MSRLFTNPPYTPLVSHQFPCSVWLPGTSEALTLYPSCLEIGGKGAFFFEDLFLEHTTRLDLLCSTITIEGMTKSGFQRLKIVQHDGFWTLEPRKRPLKGVWNGKSCTVEKHERLNLIPGTLAIRTKPRLVLASPRESTWETLIRAKKWLSLLEQLYLIDSEDVTEDSFLELEDLLAHGFSGMCVQRTGSEVFQKWGREFWKKGQTLGAFRSYLRSLFVQEDERKITLLPTCLEPSGQLLHEVVCGGDLEISFDWRKGKVRRVLLVAHKDCSLTLVLKHARSYRQRLLGKKEIRIEQVGTERMYKKGQTYLLDNFLE